MCCVFISWRLFSFLGLNVLFSYIALGFWFQLKVKKDTAMSAGAVEYTPTPSVLRAKIPFPKEWPTCDTKQSDGEAPVMLKV